MAGHGAAGEKRSYESCALAAMHHGRINAYVSYELLALLLAHAIGLGGIVLVE